MHRVDRVDDRLNLPSRLGNALFRVAFVPEVLAIICYVLGQGLPAFIREPLLCRVDDASLA